MVRLPDCNSCSRCVCIRRVFIYSNIVDSGQTVGANWPSLRKSGSDLTIAHV